MDKKVAIGGTFEFLHNGHRALLAEAFSLGRVTLGLTSDKMAEKMKKRKVKDFFARKLALENFIKKEFQAEFIIIEINDAFGPALEEDFDYIVVSPETEAGALALNQDRLKINKKVIEIVKIDFVLAKDGKPISSTRIAKGEIDIEGNLLIK
jgi:pantetheine-phosphate adenylyltransferase